MDCNCGLPAHFFVGRDGKIGYNCPRSKCKFYATAPVFCSEYSRIVRNASTPADAILIRCEAALHPEAKGGRSVPCCLLKCYGSITDRPDLLAVLEDPAYGGEWHTTAAAYIYLMEHYKTLVSRLKSMKSTLLQEIPPFFFSCLEKYRQATVQYEYLLHNDKEKDELEMDVVYQQLKPFQKKGVEFILTRGGRGMIADSMGLGKTVQAICVAHYYRQEWPVLVVCPMSLTENWVKEFNRFCGVAFSRMIVLQGPKAQVTSLHEVVIVSYSSLKYVDKKVFNVVILDESHYIKAGDSNRTKAALSLCSKANRVLLLSGTPAMSRPIELYTQMQAIQARCTPTKTQFGARYCNAFVGRFGVDYTGHMHENELHYFLRNFMIRRTKAELGGELPSKTRQLLYVTITEKERKAMEKQVSALRKSVDSAPGADFNSANARNVNVFELKNATAKAKIPAVQDYVSTIVEEHLENGEKVIFFAHHQCLMDAIKQAVEGVRPKRPIDYIFISGETPAGQREQLADHFRTDPHCPVAVLSMQSSGTGHNFTCASTVVFAELDWNPSTHLQCEDRVHRIGQSNPCSIKYLLAEGTSDTVIWSLLQTKFSVTNALMESQVRAAEGDFKTIAERSNVARRDVSPVATQSTLDGFIKSQVSQRDKTGSTTPQELSDKTATPTPDEVKQKEEPKIVISLAEMEKRGLRPMQTGMRGPPLPTVTSPIKSDPALKTAAGSVLQMLAKGAGQTKEDDDVVIVHKTPQPKADISPTPIVSLVSSMGAPSGSVPRRRTTFTLGDRSSNTPSVSPVAPVLHSSDSAPAEVVSLDNSPNRLSVHVPFKRRRSGTLIAEEGSAPIPHPPPPVVVPLVESSTVGGPVAHKRTVFKFNTAPASPSNVTELSAPASEGKSTPLFQPDFVKPSDASRPARTQFVFKKQ